MSEIADHDQNEEILAANEQNLKGLYQIYGGIILGAVGFVAETHTDSLVVDVLAYGAGYAGTAVVITGYYNALKGARDGRKLNLKS